MTRIAILAIVVALAVSRAHGADLSDYVGEWRGSGTYERIGRNEETGRLTCRLRITSPEAGKIVVLGRCAAPAGSRGFKTQITDTGGGALAGLDLSGTGGRKSSGALTGGGLSLRGNDAEGSHHFALTAPAAGSIEMRSGAESGIKSESAHVRLKKTK
ncbi:MAG: hypothetical protein R3D45_16165 [Rhizobiaceae bacterium]